MQNNLTQKELLRIEFILNEWRLDCEAWHPSQRGDMTQYPLVLELLKKPSAASCIALNKWIRSQPEWQCLGGMLSPTTEVYGIDDNGILKEQHELYWLLTKLLEVNFKIVKE